MSVSDEEIRARILAIPAFQENGVFIGERATGRCCSSTTRR